MNTATTSTRHLTFRFITIILGLFLLGAGLFKGVDLDQFAIQIRQYGILPDDARLVNAAAWLLMGVEIILGSALVVNYRPKATLRGVIVLLLLFIGTLSWAIVQGGVSDCGCFGHAVRRSPAEALIEDMLLLIITMAAWRLKEGQIYLRHPIKGWTVAAACSVALILPMAYDALNSDPQAELSEASAGENGIVLKSPSGDKFFLEAKTSLVVLMSTDCHHCQESVPKLNEIVADVGETVPVVGLAANEQADIDRFIEETFAFYPVLPIQQESLSHLLGDDPLPKFLLVRNGQVIAQWKNQVPAAQTLIDLALEIKPT